MLSPGRVIDRVAAGLVVVVVLRLVAVIQRIDGTAAPVVPGDGSGPRECIVYGPDGPEFGFYDPRPGHPRHDRDGAGGIE